MKVGDKIKKLRKQHKLTQAQLAQKLGVAPTAVSAWEGNKNRPLMDKLSIIANLFGEDISIFFDGEELTESKDITMIPVYGNVSCGPGLVIKEEPVSYEATPKSWLNGGRYIYLRAKGDSMIGARNHDGDLVLIRSQEDVENGEIAAVVIDEETVLKRVYKMDSTVILQSENNKYPPISYVPGETNNIHIIGKLKKVVINY